MDEKKKLFSALDIIKKMKEGKNHLFSSLSELQKLNNNWELIVGETYKKVSYASSVKKRSLYIECAHSSVSQDLSFQTEAIKKRASYHLKRPIDYIYFSVK